MTAGVTATARGARGPGPWTGTARTEQAYKPARRHQTPSLDGPRAGTTGGIGYVSTNSGLPLTGGPSLGAKTGNKKALPTGIERAAGRQAARGFFSKLFGPGAGRARVSANRRARAQSQRGSGP